MVINTLVRGENARSLQNAAARLVALPLTALASFGAARLTLDAVGQAGFGVVTMVLALPALLPFTDMGIGAAVTSVTAARGDTRGVVTAAFRYLSLLAVALILLASALSAYGVWSGLLGVSDRDFANLDATMLLSSVLFAVGLPLGIGQRALIGGDRYRTVILAQSAVPYLTLACLFLVHGTVSSPGAYVVIPMASQLAAGLAMFVRSLKMAGLRALDIARDVKRPVSAEVRRLIGHTAGPMAVISFGLPVALQSDRLLLSHWGTDNQLSQYALVAMLYAPLWSVATSAGMTLWPRFTVKRLTSDGRGAYLSAARAFGIAGVALASIFVACGPPLTSAWSGVRVPSSALWDCFGLLLLVQSLHLPGGMFLTRPAELRFQAVCVIAALTLNLPLSVLMIGHFGAAGPVLASAIAVGMAQWLPGAWWITRYGTRIHA